ncbi:MAG: hypothetical protein H0V97_03035 [Actinobacteria bacterium]|nr:hypothetical protein [Actinomycetota bacterium]
MLRPEIVESVLKKSILVPEDQATLFELFVGFEILDALETEGFKIQILRLLGKSTVKPLPFASLRRGQEEIDLYWQRSLWVVNRPERSGFLARVQSDNQVQNPRPFRPDFLLVGQNPPRLTLVEAKLTEKEKTRETVGIANALAYLQDAAEVLARYPKPHALVVAWGATGTPAMSEVVVSDQHSLAAATQSLLGPKVKEVSARRSAS